MVMDEPQIPVAAHMEPLPGICCLPGLSLGTNAYNLTIWETKARRLSVQGQPGLYCEFDVSLG